MKRLDKGISTSLKDNHKELSRQQDAVTRVAGEFLDRIAEEYIRDITTQTRGSHRIKRANRHGSRAVARLKILVGTAAEHAIIGYLERARLRAELADKYQRRIASRDERSSLILFVLERLVLEDILELDKMGALGAIQRVRRCIHCMSWVWCRVKNQRYCSERCRVRHYHGSAEGKRYKREWARKAYKRDRIRNAEALRIATKSVTPRKGGNQ